MDPGDPTTHAQQEAAMAKIRSSVWAEDAVDVKGSSKGKHLWDVLVTS